MTTFVSVGERLENFTFENKAMSEIFYNAIYDQHFEGVTVSPSNPVVSRIKCFSVGIRHVTLFYIILFDL